MLKILTIFILVLSLSACGFSTEKNDIIHYYVATNGSDSNPGSEALPFRTIQKAADYADAGDTIFIKAGEYAERVVLRKSGTDGNPIHFTNYANDTVTINGTNLTWGSWGGLFDLSEQSYIKVSELRLINSTAAGFFLDNSKYITISNSSTDNTFSSGIGVWNSDTITIDNNKVTLACNGGEQESITLSNTLNSEVKNNEVSNNGTGEFGGEGIDIKDGSHDILVFNNHVHHLNNRPGIYIDAWETDTYNIKVYSNRVHDNTEVGISMASEMGGRLDDISIYNNVTYSNKFGGIEVGGWSAAVPARPTPFKNISIINNTSYNNGEGIGISNADAINVIVRNNILSSNKNLQLSIEKIPLSEVHADHNLIDGNNNGLTGTDFVTGDPLFVDAGNGDFHLKINSPAIDFGSATDAPINDLDFNPRPKNGLWDIGAYEF